jgi:hypothetical protein
MRRSLALLGLGCAALAACGSSAGGKGSSAGSAGTSTGSAGTTGTAGAGVPPMCQVDILPIVPSSFDGLVAGPMMTMRVRGAVTGPVPPAYDWKWSVSLADGTPVPEASVGSDPSLVEFKLTDVGTYTIAVELTNTSCMGLRTITATRPGAKLATFRLHVTPPSTALVPAQDLQRQVMGGTPSAGNTLTLDPGIIVGFAVTRADGTPLPSYVRLTEVDSGAVIETRTSAAGPSTMRVALGSYGTVIVPDGEVAPLVFPPRAAADIGTGPLVLDDGAMVAGTVVDAGGQPVKGATIVLRNGDSVSTPGTTDATGAFHLRARAGTFGVTVVSPLAAGGLEAKLGVADGLVVDATAPTPPLAVKLQTGTLVTGTVALSAQDKDSLTPAARVSLTPAAPLGQVATLAIGAGAPKPLAGDLRFSLHPAADGTVTTGGVPPGSYSLTVFPAKADASDGVTTAALTLTAAGAQPAQVSLAQKVMLTGKLLPAAESWGVQLLAFDAGGLPVVSQASAGPDGSFQLPVSRNRAYHLRALPKPDQVLARASFPTITVANQDPPGQSYDMPPALLFAGRVVDPSLQGVSTALVQAFCFANAPGCVDATVPVAETVTRSDGSFQLMLPDPDGMP